MATILRPRTSTRTLSCKSCYHPHRSADVASSHASVRIWGNAAALTHLLRVRDGGGSQLGLECGSLTSVGRPVPFDVPEGDAQPAQLLLQAGPRALEPEVLAAGVQQLCHPLSPIGGQHQLADDPSYGLLRRLGPDTAPVSWKAKPSPVDHVAQVAVLTALGPVCLGDQVQAAMVSRGQAGE